MTYNTSLRDLYAYLKLHKNKIYLSQLEDDQVEGSLTFILLQNRVQTTTREAHIGTIRIVSWIEILKLSPDVVNCFYVVLAIVWRLNLIHGR